MDGHHIGEMQLADCEAELRTVSPAHRWAAVRELCNAAVENPRLNSDDRRFSGRCCVGWVRSAMLTPADYARAVGEFLATIDDLVFDIPKVWTYTAEMLGE